MDSITFLLIINTYIANTDNTWDETVHILRWNFTNTENMQSEIQNKLCMTTQNENTENMRNA